MSESSAKERRVSILGTGAMGTAIAKRLLSEGTSVTVWNRSKEKTIGLRDIGADVADSADAAVSASPLVISCLLSTPVLIQVLRGPEMTTALRGRTLVDTSTGSPADVNLLSEFARLRGCNQLDGKLMFYPAQVGSDQAVMYIAGPEELYRAHAPVFESIVGTPLLVGTDIAAAAVLYNAVWTFYYSGLFGFLEALAFVKRSGMDPEVFVDQALASTPDLVRQVRDAAHRVGTGDLGGDQAAVAVYVDGFQTMRNAFGEVGLRSRMLETLSELSSLAEAGGYGRADIAAVTNAVIEEDARQRQRQRQLEPEPQIR
ncbi:NAD(P)-dependent oxidoreductase [Leifsonia sp. 2MCAF36]|uniref:NAD(P)-dependent oxidoreductase n=1 Tax=Leifsonia sp. 2MCAF36 TaxID=3232988 RepID=UPI003F9736EF